MSETADEYYYNHLIISKKSKKYKNDVNQIINRIKQSNIKGVILYFHGGLSSEKYMREKLAPALMDSIFTDGNLSDPNDSSKSFYPIFMNYEAGIFENMFLTKWIVKKGYKPKKIEKALEKFESQYKKKADKKSFTTNNFAKKLFEDAWFDKTDNKSLVETLSDEQIYEFLAQDDDKNQKKVGRRLIKNNPEFQELEKDLESAQTSGKKDFLNLKFWIAFARSIARLIAGNNHQIIPTFEEEIFSIIGVKSIAVNHWKDVKDKSSNAFSDGFVGKYFIDELLKLQKNEKKSLTINTLSHSAGSIPTARLVDYLSAKNEKIDNVVMIVPAINQRDFNKLIIDNNNVINTLKLYILSQKAEKKDRTAKIYPASLLYFVSGCAENVKYNDKMLMIEQHLKKDKRPYRKNSYRKKFNEEQAPKVWDFIEKNPDVLSLYPTNNNDYNKKKHSHKYTKFPWCAEDLALNILQQFHNTSKSFKIKIPKDVDIKDKCNKNDD